MALPSEYKQVEYIQSSGTQYINTGYIPSNNTKVECTIGGWNTGTGQYGTMFGTRLEWSSSGRGFMLDYDSTNSRVLYMFGGGYNPNVGFSFPSGGKHTIEFSLGGVYEDGTLRFTPSSVTFTSPANLYISALNDNGTVKEFGGFKLYSFKIYNSSTLVRDFIPVVRKSDNKPGLYDLVNNVFYTNAGTGEFEYPAQSGKITHIYLGTNLIRPAPSEITEEFTVPNPGTAGGILIAKSGYKITKIVAEWESYTTSGGWGVSGIHIHRDTDAPYNLHNNFSMGGTYGYCYSTTTDIGCYGASRILQSGVSNALAGVWVNSSATTAQRNAAIMTYTKDTFEYKIGQTLSNLTQTGTISLSASAQTAMKSLFTDPDLRAYTNRWNNINPYQVKKVTVTYEPV